MSISTKKKKQILDKMAEFKIYEKDIEEKFVRSSGKGGQKVNKSATCVYIKHLPTGIEVKCQVEREQALNRILARRILADKIEEQVKGRASAIRQKIEKIRRQKRKRSKRAKAKMLDDKKKHSEKKNLRKKVEI